MDVDLKEDDQNDPDSFTRNLRPVFVEAIQNVFDGLETAYDSTLPGVGQKKQPIE